MSCVSGPDHCRVEGRQRAEGDRREAQRHVPRRRGRSANRTTSERQPSPAQQFQRSDLGNQARRPSRQSEEARAAEEARPSEEAREEETLVLQR